MICNWTSRFAPTFAIAILMAGPSVAQRPGGSSPYLERTPPVTRTRPPAENRVATPLYEMRLPPVSLSQPDRLPSPYGPSAVGGMNPFDDVHVGRLQLPANLDGTGHRVAAQFPRETSGYRTYVASAVASEPQAVGGGLAAVSLEPKSFYDQPRRSNTPQHKVEGDPKSIGCSACSTKVRSGWYGGVAGLIMSRDRENNLWLSYDQTDLRDRVLSSHDAGFSYAGGVAANIGHYFNCGKNSIELVYWGIYPGLSEANAYGADTAAGIDTILHFDALQYDPGTGAQDLAGTFFFGAERHRVQREYQAHNIELNLLGHNYGSECCPLQLGWTAGVRYLRFDDDFLYSSDPNDLQFTNTPEEVHYDVDVENNLIGIQIGGRADYCVGGRLSLFADTKVGIYGNHISHHSRIYGSNGLAFVGDAASPYFGQDVDIHSNKGSFAMIGDVSIGANWCVTPCWTINAGYRAVAVNGVALSTNQVPVDFIAALDSVRAVDSNGCLILHGAFAGITFCY